MEERGLAFRSIDKIKDALQGKLLWQVLFGHSLWEKFIRAKYFVRDQPIVTINASSLWRSLVTHYMQLHQLSRWVVGTRLKSFWMNNWFGEVLTGLQPVDATVTIE